MPFYAVCYGHACRYEQAGDEEEATRLAFGVSLDDRITVKRLPKSPRYMSQKTKIAFLGPLALEHHRRTGSVLSGWEREIAAATKTKTTE